MDHDCSGNSATTEIKDEKSNGNNKSVEPEVQKVVKNKDADKTRKPSPKKEKKNASSGM